MTENEDKPIEFSSDYEDDIGVEFDEPLSLNLKLTPISSGLGDIKPQAKRVCGTKLMSIESRLLLVEELQNAHDECIELINANDSGFPG